MAREIILAAARLELGRQGLKALLGMGRDAQRAATQVKKLAVLVAKLSGDEGQCIVDSLLAGDKGTAA